MGRRSAARRRLRASGSLRLAMPAAPEPDIAEITENFAFFDDWEDRFAYLIDLGKKLPPMPEELVDEPHRVHGCQSSVWLHLRTEPVEPAGDDRAIDLLAKSDAHIVNGLIAVLRGMYQGRTLGQVAGIDAEAKLRELGLSEHLSPTRRNGVGAMVERIRLLAGVRQAEAKAPEGS